MSLAFVNFLVVFEPVVTHANTCIHDTNMCMDYGVCQVVVNIDLQETWFATIFLPNMTKVQIL